VMEETLDDLIVPWALHGPRLAREMLALADDLDNFGSSHAADLIRHVIRCEVTRLPVRPQLGDPPTLRPAVPHAPEPGS
jgi:hypothetical protein